MGTRVFAALFCLSLFEVGVAFALPKGQVPCPAVWAIARTGQYVKLNRRGVACYNSIPLVRREGYTEKPFTEIAKVTPKVIEMSGSTNAVSEKFTITQIPASLEYSYVDNGNYSDWEMQLSIELIDAESGLGDGFPLQAMNKKEDHNTVFITQRGYYFLRIKAGTSVTWSIRLEYQ